MQAKTTKRKTKRKSKSRRKSNLITAGIAALKNFDQLPDSAFVRYPAVCALFSIASATGWRWVKAGRIPAPRKLSDRVSGWNVGQLRAALQRAAA